MAVKVFPTTANLSGTCYTAEVYNLGAFSTTYTAAFTTPLSIPVTFTTGSRKNSGLALILAGSSNSIDRDVKASLQQIMGTCTVNAGTDEVTFTAHGFSDGQAVMITAATTQPGGITVNTIYYARATGSSVPADTFFLYDTSAHAIAGGATGLVNITSTGTGTLTLYAERGQQQITTATIVGSRTTSTRANCNGYIVGFSWTGYTINTSASTWRFFITQVGGTTGNWSAKQSTSGSPFYCEVSDISSTVSANDTIVVLAPVTVDTSVTVKGTLGTSETNYAPAVWIGRSVGAVTLTGGNSNLLWGAESNYTLTVDGGIALGGDSSIQVGSNITFTGALSAGATSGTLTAGWSGTTGSYQIHFNNSTDGLNTQYKNVTLTNGSTAVSWTGGLTVAVVAGAFVANNGGRIAFLAPSVGTKSGFWDLDAPSSTDPRKMSCIIHGKVPDVEKTTITSVSGTALVTATSTGWAVNDKITIGRTTTIGTVDATLYNINAISGTSITLGSSIAAARTAGGQVIRHNGYGFKIGGPSSGTKPTMTMREPSNFQWMGVEFWYFSSGSGPTRGGVSLSEDTADYSQHLYSHCSAYSDTSDSVFALPKLPSKGTVIEYNNNCKEFVAAGFFFFSSDFGIAGFYDHNVALNMTQGGPGTSNSCIFSNNISENGSNNLWVVNGVGFTFTGNDLWGSSYVIGALYVAGGGSAIPYLWRNNRYNNNSFVFDTDSFVILNSTGDIFGDVLANTTDFAQRGTYQLWKQKYISTTGVPTVSTTNFNTALPGTYLRLEQVNNVSTDYRSWYPQGHFASSSSKIDAFTDVTTQTLTNTYVLSSGTVSGLKLRTTVGCKIGNAAYYAGTYTAPALVVNYDTASVDTQSASNSTSQQTLASVVTFATSNNQPTVSFTQKTDASIANSKVTWGDLTFASGAYPYTPATFTKTLFGTTDDIIYNVPTPTTDPYVTTSSGATVAAWSNITFDHTNKIITISGQKSGGSDWSTQDLYDRSLYEYYAQNLAYAQWFTTTDKLAFVSTYDIVLSTGVNLVGGGSVNVGVKAFTKNGTATYNGIIITSTNRTVHVTLTTPLSGALYEVYNGSGTTLGSGTGTGSTIDFVVTKTTDVAITYVVRQFGYLEVRGTGTITDTGLSIVVVQSADPNTASYPGGIATDFTIDATTGVIAHASGTTVYTVKQLYNYQMDYMANSARMQKSLKISAQTQFDFTLINSATISDADHNYLKGGSITEASGNTLWANVFTNGTVVSGTQIYIDQNGSTISAWWGTGNLDVLIKVKSSGSLVDSGNVYLRSHRWGYTYDRQVTNLANGGRTAVAISNAIDTNNTSSTGTVSAYGITKTEGLATHDIGDGAGAQPYNIAFDDNTKTALQIYEWGKYITRDASGVTIEGVAGELWMSTAGGTEITVAPMGTYAGGVFFGPHGVWHSNIATADSLNYILTDNNGVTHQVATPPVSLEVTNIISGSRIQLYDLTDSTELLNEIVSGTSDSVVYTYPGTDHDIRIRLSYVDGSSTAYYFYETQSSALITGMSVRAEQIANSVYVANAIDGSAVTEFSVSGTTVKCYVDDTDNTTTIQRAYNWFQYMLFTESGIRDQGNYVRATDTTNYVFYSSIQFKNLKTDPLVIDGGYFVLSTGGTPVDCYDLTGGPIFMGYPHVVGFSYSSGSGLSTAEHDALMAVPVDVRLEMDANSVKLDDAATGALIRL